MISQGEFRIYSGSRQTGTPLNHTIYSRFERLLIIICFTACRNWYEKWYGGIGKCELYGQCSRNDEA